MAKTGPGSDPNMAAEEQVRAILEEPMSDVSFTALPDPAPNDLGAIEEAFNSEAARQLFTSSVSLDFDLGNLLSEYKVEELLADGGRTALNERRMRMRRQLSASGELTPQLQQLNLRVKDEPDRTQCPAERGPGPPARSIAVNNPLLASLLESSGAKGAAPQCAPSSVPSPSYVSEPSFAGPGRADGAPCHIKREKPDPSDGLGDGEYSLPVGGRPLAPVAPVVPVVTVEGSGAR
ncbi:uncharacterized protein LOC119108507 [Pollicipes pollicipes]|uniref:uncharacterized protein LOC119108507 n=1 Tax=Pollicipes pollicipes TaxID=41117 RepID=UPI001884DE54|nr:uncharacterized protein LOC119108507 [Pollicipes pollicipes]